MMDIRCNEQCDACLRDKRSVYICLKSEGEFLSSLLRLGGDTQGKRNLLGYGPSELIDWYLYAKRSFSTWPSIDPFGWSIKLLDELGKILFGLTQVTARAPDDYPNPAMQGKLLLLRPLEQNLVESFLGKDFFAKQMEQPIVSQSAENLDYAQIQANAKNVCRDAGAQLRRNQAITTWRDRYQNHIECRIAYTNIEHVGVFYWTERGASVLLILRARFDDEREDPDRISRLRLACAYLHGVARFALPTRDENPNATDAAVPPRLGYWIDECSSEPSQVALHSIRVSNTDKQQFALVPSPSSPQVRLSCEVAASLAQEYWRFFDPKPQPDQALFDVIFMCKEKAGWFWCLTKSQLQHLQQRWGNDSQRCARALERFRFNRAGIINHLERTESLVAEVYHFEEEDFICLTVGYHLEDASEEAENFKHFEESLPFVDKSSYFYFRITPHIPASSFSVDDLTDVPLLVDKLKQATRAVDLYLAGRLPTTKDALLAYRGANSDPAPLQAALVQDFNSVIRGPSIYEPKRFLGVTLRSATEHLRSQKPEGDDLIRLNRLLLEDAYPLELSQNRKVLPEGALVALFRFDREGDAGSIIMRLKRMAVIRHLVERWRAKVHSLEPVAKTVRELARPSQEKTARAAIMSRNLSHNVGSHALANSRFFEAVGVLNAQERAPGEDEGFEALSFPHPIPLRAASPPGSAGSLCPVCLSKIFPKGPISRNDEGNVLFEEKTVNAKPAGKPLMANRPVLKGEAWRARNRLGAMNSYLQGRLDFIARALGETSSQPEPMFFVNDLLMGFLSQSVLLNTLLSDNGYTANKLDFVVKLPSGTMTFNGTAKDHQIRHADFVERGKFQDVLVAVPGGMVGRHAFYAFLENFMRNAAKYGPHSRTRAALAGKERFEIHLDLRAVGQAQGAFSPNGGAAAARRTDSCYVLTIHDNLSADPYGAAADRVRSHLNEPIIDAEGKPRTEGHGIQEMKVCAQFLAGGETDALVFPKDQELTDDGGCLGAAYKAYSETALVKITQENSLACHPHPLGESFDQGDRALAYSILLQQPRLIGIAQYGVVAACPAREADKEPTVVFYDSIARLSEKPAYFGLIKIEPSQVASALEEIAKCHTALPYRLMLVVDGDYADKVSDLRKQVDQWQKERSAAWFQKRKAGQSADYFPLPTRRVRVIDSGDLFRMTHQSESAQLRDLTIRIYDKWLEAFKGDELQRRAGSANNSSGLSAPKWNLAIGFQRTMKGVLSKWNLGANDAINLGFDPQSTQVSLYLFFDPEYSGNRVVNCAYNQSLRKVNFEGESSLRATLLALDNHGHFIANEAKKGFGETGSIPVYHPFSGSQQVDLFQLLDSPPTDQFSRSFLVYSVVEALLTKVVVVDERVAEACIEEAAAKPQAFGANLREKQRAGIFPLYGITTRKEGPRHLLSETARIAVENVWPCNSEGLYLAGTSSIEPATPEIRSATLDSNGRRREVLLSSINDLPDFIVIHEGVTDSLKSKELWNKGDHQPLYAICPAVVRTSGRGSISRDLGEELPFYEFSELSDSTYRQMNKVALARGLLALRGNPLRKQ